MNKLSLWWMRLAIPGFPALESAVQSAATNNKEVKEKANRFGYVATVVAILAALGLLYLASKIYANFKK